MIVLNSDIFIVILPSDTPDEVYELLRYKGLTLDKLIYIVHCSDGILGPAHPYGEPFMSFCFYYVLESVKADCTYGTF